MDFKAMFNIPRALFILLHECGHQIVFNDFRKKRLEIYIETLYANVLDHLLRFYYMDLTHAITKYRIDQVVKFSEKEKGRDIYIADFAGHEQMIKDMIVAISTVMREQLCKKWDIYKQQSQIWEEEYSVENRFARHVLNFPKTMLSICEYENKQMLNDFYQRLYAKFEDLIDDAKKDARNDVWYLALPKYEFHHDRLVDDAVYYTLESMKTRIEGDDSIADTFIELFGEIYSDLFAFYILRFNHDPHKSNKQTAYKELMMAIIANEGFNFPTWITLDMVLYRILAVWVGMECGTLNELIDFFKDVLEYEIPDEVKLRLEVIEKTLTYEYIMEYVNLCKKSLSDSIKSINELRIVSEEIRKLYDSCANNQTANVVEQIHYFWKLSTQRPQ